jgi:hypothetical protein
MARATIFSVHKPLVWEVKILLIGGYVIRSGPLSTYNRCLGVPTLEVPYIMLGWIENYSFT